MLTFDGYGYGKSIYWMHRANTIAKEIGENCEHEGIIPQFEHDPYRERGLKIKVFCVVCQNRCSETEKKVLKEFLKFYHLDKDLSESI